MHVSVPGRDYPEDPGSQSGVQVLTGRRTVERLVRDSELECSLQEGAVADRRQ